MVRVRTVYRNAGSGTAHAFHTSSAERAGTPRAAATLVAPVPVRIAYRGVRPFAFPAGRPPAPAPPAARAAKPFWFTLVHCAHKNLKRLAISSLSVFLPRGSPNVPRSRCILSGSHR